MQYGGFCGIGGLGGSSSVHALSNAGDSNVNVLMSHGKVIGSKDLPSCCLSGIDQMSGVIGSVYVFHDFVLPLRWVRGRMMGLGNRARVSYSNNADGQRLASIMVIGLPAAYVEFQVAMGFTAYVLYGCWFSSLLKK